MTSIKQQYTEVEQAVLNALSRAHARSTRQIFNAINSVRESDPFDWEDVRRAVSHLDRECLIYVASEMTRGVDVVPAYCLTVHGVDATNQISHANMAAKRRNNTAKN